MSTASYNCPCCGGPLKFSGESGKLECTACGNAFEQCCPVPAVGMLNIAMREAGALGGAMSGSGTAVFGIFSNRQAACAAKEQLAPRFAGCRFFVTEPKQSGIVFA